MKTGTGRQTDRQTERKRNMTERLTGQELVIATKQQHNNP